MSWKTWNRGRFAGYKITWTRTGFYCSALNGVELDSNIKAILGWGARTDEIKVEVRAAE